MRQVCYRAFSASWAFVRLVSRIFKHDWSHCNLLAQGFNKQFLVFYKIPNINRRRSFAFVQRKVLLFFFLWQALPTFLLSVGYPTNVAFPVSFLFTSPSIPCFNRLLFPLFFVKANSCAAFIAENHNHSNAVSRFYFFTPTKRARF